MPPRKHVKPLPRFAFAAPEYNVTRTSWRKKHSKASRSHAAYWGGRPTSQDDGSQQAEGTKDNKTSDASSTDEHSYSEDTWSGSSRFSISTDVACQASRWLKARNVIVAKKKPGQLRHFQYNNLIYLPKLPDNSTMTRSKSAIEMCLITLRFCGESFVKHFLMADHEDYLIFYTGYLLLSHAHHIAITGHGTKIDLLELKGEVISLLRAKMKSSGEILSPHCLTAVLSLGAPLVCLLSRNLPRGLSIREYINESMKDDYHLCCRESADIAERSLHERIVHQQAMRRLLHASKSTFRDQNSHALTQYISNYMNISIALEAADYPNTPFVDVRDLFPSTSPCKNCCVLQGWVSPLTCQCYFDKTASSHAETKMLVLAEFTHRWLATILSENNDPLAPTKRLIDMRAKLRQDIEGLVPVAEDSTSEAEAMYESCRWASLILLSVEKQGIPIYKAAQQVKIRLGLVRCLRMTDLINLWGIHKGLLFWVTATYQFATAGQCFPLLCTTILTQFTQEMAVSLSSSDVAIKSLKKLKMFESLCCEMVTMA